MPMSKSITDDAELAKSYITNSNLSDEYKRVYLKLISISTMATNGITTEEKIQKMTECIQLLAVTQGMYLANIDKKIQTTIDNANIKQCVNCKAMKHANDIEQQEHEKQIIDKYLESIGFEDSQTIQQINEQTELSWTNVLKQALIKPYIYVVACLLVISPYGVEITKLLLQFFGK